MYAVLQIGHAVYGVGETPDDAVRDAAEWLEQPWEVVPLREAVYGDLVIVPCSERFAARYEECGGDFRFEIVDGEAYLPDELEDEEP